MQKTGLYPKGVTAMPTVVQDMCEGNMTHVKHCTEIAAARFSLSVKWTLVITCKPVYICKTHGLLGREKKYILERRIKKKTGE